MKLNPVIIKPLLPQKIYNLPQKISSQPVTHNPIYEGKHEEIIDGLDGMILSLESKSNQLRSVRDEIIMISGHLRTLKGKFFYAEQIGIINEYPVSILTTKKFCFIFGLDFL